MVARRMLGDELPPKSSPNPPARRCRSKGRRHGSPSPTAAAPSRGRHHRPHQPGQGTGDPPESCRNIKGLQPRTGQIPPVQWEVDKEQEQEFRTGISIEIVNHQGAWRSWPT